MSDIIHISNDDKTTIEKKTHTRMRATDAIETRPNCNSASELVPEERIILLPITAKGVGVEEESDRPLDDIASPSPSVAAVTTTNAVAITEGPVTNTGKKSSFSRIFAKVFGHQSKPVITVMNEPVKETKHDGVEATTDKVDPTSITIEKKDEPETQQGRTSANINSTENRTATTTKKRKGSQGTDIGMSAYLLKKTKKLQEASVDTSQQVAKTTGSAKALRKIATTVTEPVRSDLGKRPETVGMSAATSYGPGGTVVVTERQKRGRPTKTTYRPVTQIDLHHQLQQINDAVAVVTQTLHSSAYPALFMNQVNDNQINSRNNNSPNINNVSLWPSPYRTLNGKTTHAAAQQQIPYSVNTMSQHHTHMSSVCASIEKFANDIVQPAILSEIRQTLVVDHKRNGRDNRNSKNNRNKSLDAIIASSRAFFGTLLLLRELLIQNIHAIFGPSVMMTLQNNRRNETHSSKLPTTNDTNTPAMHLSLSEVQEFEKQIFVSAIILTGLQNAAIINGNHYKCRDGSDETRTSDSMMDAFLYCMDMYEYVASEFICCCFFWPMIFFLTLYFAKIVMRICFLVQSWTFRLF